MITKGDDYPIHQLPIPISEVGTERNFYDRYFFNGYNEDGSIFFATALCVYPNLNLIDGSFVLVIDGTQHNFRYSDILNQERLDTSVGSLKVVVIEPLKELRIEVDDKEKGIRVELNFSGRFEPMQEPRMTMKSGPRTTMDSTRMTQHGLWKGQISFKDREIDVSEQEYKGSRDRSWGVRPVGLPDSQMLPPLQIPQFYWLWAPANFDDCTSHLYFVDDLLGNPTHSHCVIQKNTKANILNNLKKEISYKEGTRRIEEAKFTAETQDGSEISWILEPKYHIYMCGLGYMHPEWGHGHFKGENQSTYDSYDLNEDMHDPPFLHIQAICDFTLKDKNETKKGLGVLEELLIGPHAPSGFKELLDGYK
tara:strand:+ start:1644 stop:2738 length:1095 start_codon:yes stop_codon:yes gene_type:complete